MIFTQTITDALNKGYEITFRAARDISPDVLIVELRKDDIRHRQIVDYIDGFRDGDISTEDRIDYVIQYSMREIDRVKRDSK